MSLIILDSIGSELDNTSDASSTISDINKLGSLPWLEVLIVKKKKAIKNNFKDFIKNN